jgi:hypothetical protein
VLLMHAAAVLIIPFLFDFYDGRSLLLLLGDER